MAKQAHISYLIWWHLNHYHGFKLPGIASFKSEIENAHINHLESLIYPARLKLSMVPEDDTDPTAMVGHLHDAFGYDSEELNEQIKTLGQYLRVQLEKNGRIEWQPFGSLIMEGTELKFIQSDINLLQDVYGAGPLPLEPIQKVYSPSGISSAVNMDSIPKRKENSLKALWITLGILWLIFLALLFWPDHLDGPVSTQNENNELGSQLNAEDSLLLGSRIVRDSLEIPDASLNSSGQTPVIDHEAGETLIDSIKLDSISNAIQNKPCIIIVGSFLNPSNAQKLESKLEKLNYEVYRGSYKNFHRVGVKFNCMTRDLKSVLAELQQTIHPQAWVLKM